MTVSIPETTSRPRRGGVCGLFGFLCALPLAALPAGIVSAVPAQAADCRSQPAPGVDWQDCNKSNIVIRGANLSGANMTGTDLTLTDLRETRLTGAKLQKATLVRSSLAGADARGADFSRVEAYRTSFARIVATGTNFSNAELQRADFAGAELIDADFEKAELGRADFKGAIIGGAKFAYANLSRAHFTDATINAPIDLTGAFMFLARVESVDLSAATGLTQAQIDLACGDAETKLPSGLVASQSWPCSFD